MEDTAKEIVYFRYCGEVTTTPMTIRAKRLGASRDCALASDNGV